MKQRYSLKSNAVKFRLLTLTLLTLLTSGGMKAIGQTAFTLDYTDSDDKTYYVTSTDVVAESANNTDASGPLAYKFYVSESATSLTNTTKYDHFYMVHVNNASATVTFIFQTDKPVGFSNGPGTNSDHRNAFKVTKGTLILKLDKDHYDSDITLRRVGDFTATNNNCCPFFLINVEGEASDQKLIIEGLDPELDDLLYQVNNVKQDTATYRPKRQFVIDGAANISSVSMTTGDPTYTGIATNKKPLFRVETGTLHLTNVTIQNSINSASDATHGGIFLMLNDNADQRDRNLDVILTHCWLHNLVSTNFKTGYPGIGLQWQMRKAHGSGSVVLKRSKFTSISNNSGQEAAIRSTTGCKASVTIDSCNINNNFGGGIRWQGLVADPMQVKNTTIKGNYTKKSGGGIMAKSPLVLTACKILNNTAYKHGGGINYMCYDETGMTEDEAGKIYPNNLELTMDAATIIDGNKTETGNGGGIMVWGRLINLTRTGQMGYVYHEYDQNGNVVGPYQMKVNLNGATIQNNTAHNNGGGIFIYREAGTGTDPVSGEGVRDASCYLIDCKLSYGNIKGNKALNGSGGGVCINQTGTPNLDHVNDDHPAESIVLTTGGLAYDMTINENDAKLDGGGIYLYSINDGDGWNEHQKFETKVTLKDRTKIQSNTAYLSQTLDNSGSTDHGGGGLFVQEGNVTIAGTEPAGETNNPLIEANKTKYSGGGICLIKGNIFAEYSRVVSNQATDIEINNQSTNDAIGRGGGVYLKEGDITLRSSKIYTNRVNKYGGGIYCLGTISASTVDLTDSEVKGNIADNHGGGIYLHEGIINITTSTIGGTSYADANVAGAAINDCKGGGIYTQTGNVNILGSKISYNISNRRGGGIYTKSGPVIIKSSEISYNRAGYRKVNGNVVIGNAYGTGGGIHTDGGLVTINPNEDEATPTEIKYNRARLNGGGIFTGTEGTGSTATKGKVAVYGNRQGEDGHLINIEHNVAENGSGGGIFCLGDSDGQRYVLLRRVNLSNNKAGSGTGTSSQPSETISVTSRCGGGLYLQQGLIDMNLCTVNNNTAKLNGGGVNNHQGNINVLSCYIRENEAGKDNSSDAGSGGGMYTHSGTIGVNYWGTPATIQNEARRTEITDNTAKLNGGGLNTHNGKILVHGNSDASNQRILINNNTATKGSGGGIFCMGQPASGSGHTNFITLQHVDMKLNKALSGKDTYTDTDNNETVRMGCGGAVYLQLGKLKATDVVMQNNLANKNGGAINNHDGFVDIFGCVIGGEDYYDGSTLNGRGNKANNSGGGIYTNKGDIDVEDYIEHGQGSSKRYESKLSYNEAVENGGALDTHSGTIWVNKNQRDDQTEITYNKAKKGGGIYANEGTIFVNNTRVDNNIATENGGGVNNHAGDITFRGGTLNNNTAQKGRGGGAFTYVGDINILPFPSTKTSPTRDDGTKIFNNLAQINGGGINNHTGRVDIRHAALRNNTATLGNGGGIFCEGPHSNSTGYTIRLLNSELMENKTRGQDGTPQDPTGRGGGIYLKYGSIYAHSSDIIENFANVNGGGLDNHDGSILVYGCNIIGNEAVTGRGGGIYTQTGNITTGPASSKASVIHSNIAKINGGGINNHQGDIFLNGDLIFNNEADSCGGGIYIKNGTIEMYGGKIANNTAGVDGGGVWSGGGTFAIQQRVGKPVVEIIAVDTLKVDQTYIHYHLIDNGNNEGNTVSHGVYWTDDGWETTNSVTFSTQPTGFENSETNCFRIKLGTPTALDASKTYEVVSWAKYTKNSTDYIGLSDTTTFTVFGTLPVVISGTTANITKNSAEGSGKLLYSNGATICGVCYIQKDGNLTSLSDLEVGKTGVEKKVDTLSSGTFPNNHFFIYTLTPLANGKKYFARAYASNDGGSTYIYGDTVSFVTLKDTPEMTGELSVTGMTFNNETGKYDVSFEYTMANTGLTAYGFGISSESNTQLLPGNIVGGTAVAATETVPAHFVGTKVGLDPGTAYYVRAFASKAPEEGGNNPALDLTNYSLTEPLQFFTPDANGLPVVRLLRLSNITQNSVTYTAKLIDQGSGAITRYGLCYSTTNMLPTEHGTECNHDEHNGTLAVGQEFTFTITGLDLNQTYYLRAFATNKSLTPEPGDEDYGYSNEFNFSTLPAEIPFVLITTVDPIGQTTATVNCSVNDGGGGNITDWGIKYSATDNIVGAIDINKPGGGTTLSGNTFAANLPKTGETALTKNTDYYVWAYATNSVGTHTTSHWTRFRTAYDIPTVTNVTVSEIAYNANATAGQQNTARFVATATPTGTPTTNIKTRGVCWSTNQDPVRMMSDYTDSQFIEVTDNNGWNEAQTIDYAGRIQKYPNTRYYVRAYASVNTPDADNTLADIIYSNTQTMFTTLPAMQTDGVTNITDVSATLGGTILSRDGNGYLDGGTYGICWGTSPNPTKGTGNYVEETISGSHANTRPYTLNATGLTPNTTYYYRAYYDRGSEIAYGKQPENPFTTKAFHLIVDCSPAVGGTATPTYVAMNAGETVSVTATNNLGYSFDNWTFTGGGTSGTTGPSISSSTATTTTFKMGSPGANAFLTANFSHTEYTITVQASPAGGGILTGGASNYHYGDNATLTATVNEGYRFVNWTLNGEEVDDETSITVTVTGDATYVANFEYLGRGSGASAAPASSRPRDIYPAPAREPWNWETLEVETSEPTREDDPTVLPKVITGNITVINASSATCTGTVIPGSSTVTAYGICWGTSIDPTTSGNKTVVTATGTTQFEIEAQTMIGLSGSVPYYVRAYATDENGTVYGANKIFLTDNDPVNLPSIDHNIAERGGGVFMTNSDTDPTRLIFAGGADDESIGKIIYNYANEAGGGIYIDTNAYMQMMGHCEVNANWVPEDKSGGGIYLSGRLYVGDKKTDGETVHSLMVNKNFATSVAVANISTIEGYYTGTFDKSLRNNVFLARNEYDFDLAGLSENDDMSNVITLLSNISGTYPFDVNNNGTIDEGEEVPFTQIGFNVQRGFCPVIATAKAFSENYMNEGDSDADGDYFNTSSGSDPTYEPWLKDLMPEGYGTASAEPGALTDNGSIFEDSETYIAIHTQVDLNPFRSKYIYLWGSWTNPAVSEDPERNTGEGGADMSMRGSGKHYKIKEPDMGNAAPSKILEWEIYSEEGLSWFSSYVNGLNAFSTGDVVSGTTNDTIHRKYNQKFNPYAKAILMNDLDMTKYFWVPIGSVTKFVGNPNPTASNPNPNIYSDEDQHCYKGVFDGQGHIIKGIDCRFLTGVVKFGLFGELTQEAVVKNVFVDDANYFTDKTDLGYYVGGVAGKVSGTATLSASEARSKINVKRSKKANTYVGGLVGQAAGSAVVHSSMAMPEIHGSAKYVGGLVGELGVTNKLLNSFSNPIFPDASYIDTCGTTPEYTFMGGLVGVNNGAVENCYSRLQGNEPKGGYGTYNDKSIFGWFAGTNGATIRYCYGAKEQMTNPTPSTENGGGVYLRGGNDPIGHGQYTGTELVNGKYGFKHRDQAVEATNSYVNNDTLIGGLQRALNAWVKDATNNGWNATTNTNSRGYAVWSRTMASTINDDLPVPMLSDFNSVGSQDHVYMHYKHDVNDMLETYTTLSQEDYLTPAIYLYDTIMDGSDTVSISKTNIGTTHPNVMFAINEKVGILQDANLRARVGVTFDNSDGTTANGGAPYDWHMFSSALQSAPMGLKYYDDNVSYAIQKEYSRYKANGISEGEYHERRFMDPPRTSWSTEHIGYFPTNTPYGSSFYSGQAECGPDNATGSFDFYCFYEQERHWINFKRKGVEGFYDHWYQDSKKISETADPMHYNIEYPNETNMVVGKGYMMGVSQASMLMTDGTLNNGDGITTPVTNYYYSHNPSIYAEELRGTNLVGNPYQSYLDFNAFIKANSNVISGSSYYVFDADAGNYLCYPATSSTNPINASQYINPHQGFMVMVKGSADNNVTTSLTFNNNMRKVAGDDNSSFRSDRLNYPLVNLLCYDSEGKRDATTVEINRPDVGGALKMKKLISGKMLLYARQDNKDYQTAFTPVGTTSVPVRFEAFEDGVYTMNWQTFHGDFSYLHLIDNMTGADVDMLRSTEYRFEASTSDYLSRFKLVFEATGLEEEDDNEDDNGSSIVNFAFRMGDELIVNGAGYLEVFDVQGRRLSAKRLVDAQSSVSLPNVAAGIYFLRLSDDKQVRTQKMVINY